MSSVYFIRNTLMAELIVRHIIDSSFYIFINIWCFFTPSECEQRDYWRRLLLRRTTTRLRRRRTRWGWELTNPSVSSNECHLVAILTKYSEIVFYKNQNQLYCQSMFPHTRNLSPVFFRCSLCTYTEQTCRKNKTAKKGIAFVQI